MLSELLSESSKLIEAVTSFGEEHQHVVTF
jgi:hypothetical protein